MKHYQCYSGGALISTYLCGLEVQVLPRCPHMRKPEKMYAIQAELMNEDVVCVYGSGWWMGRVGEGQLLAGVLSAAGSDTGCSIPPADPARKLFLGIQNGWTRYSLVTTTSASHYSFHALMLCLFLRAARVAQQLCDSGLVHRTHQRHSFTAAGAAHSVLHQEEQRREVFR